MSPWMRAKALLRRLGAMVYDGLLVLAVLMVATALWLPSTGGEAVTPEVVGPLAFRAYQVSMAILAGGFFGLFWVRRGQTLGMAAWHLTVIRVDGGRFTWMDALKRLAASLLSWLPAGLGFLWMLVDRDGLAWHDRLTETRIVHEPRRK
jgi:uncharacterized RDD family membrane protein YckC